MQFSNEILTVSVNSIFEAGPHLFWPATAHDTLMESIREFGQASPVLVCETEKGLELIAGHGRVAVLRELGQSVLARLVLDADERDMGVLYLADNAQRSVDDGMRLAALKYFATLMDERALKADILPRLGVKPKSKDGRLLFSWLAMAKNWQDHLAAGNIPLAAVDPLGRMTDADRNAVEPLFADFSWSRSNAVNVLTWLFETSKMKGAPVADVLEQAGMIDVLRQGLSPKDAIARLCSAARIARFPELSRLQDRFVNIAGGLTTGTRWRLVQPNNFETGGAELTIQVKDASQLERAVSDLETMAKASAWDEIWGLGGTHD